MTSSGILLRAHSRVVRRGFALLALAMLVLPGTSVPGSARSERAKMHGIAHFCVRRLEAMELGSAEKERLWQRCLHSQAYRDQLWNEYEKAQEKPK